MRFPMRSVLALLVLGALGACDAEESTPSSPSKPSPSAAPSSPTSPSADAGSTHVASEALRKCAEAQGAIASIGDVIARLNALAPSADGPCFVAALPRPLEVVATHSVTSAQPAAGRESPRLFFLLPKLVISAVPEGDGSKLLELGEWVTTTRTIKGELELPVTSKLAPDAAFQKILQGDDRTVCATCHREESAHPSIPKAFVSMAFRPNPGTLVTVAELEAFHETCTRENDESARCAMLHALFDFGEVKQGAFSPEVETFY